MKVAGTRREEAATAARADGVVRRAPFTAGRAPGLDLVRALAIAWVTIYHASTFGLVPVADHWLVRFGWMGVDLFFVLSGFLIAGQLFRPLAAGGRIDVPRFFARRLLRTIPAYAVVVVAYFAVPAVRERAAIQPLWQFLTFTENLLIEIEPGKAFSHVWSLCVEEQFYLVLPVLVLWLSRRPSPRGALALFASLVIFGACTRGLLWWSQVADPARSIHGAATWQPYMRWIYYPTWSRLDGLLAGVAVAAIQVFRPALWRRLTGASLPMLACGLAIVAMSIAWFGDQIAAFWPTVFAFPLLAVGLAAIVAALADSRSWLGRRRIPGSGPLAALAYSLYLVQKAVFGAFRPDRHVWVQDHPWLGLGAALLSATAVAVVLHRCVERPFLNLRDRLDQGTRPRRSTGAASAEAPGRDQALLPPTACSRP